MVHGSMAHPRFVINIFCATLFAVAAGCGSSDDQRTVSGRSRSVTSALGAELPTATLRLVATKDLATGEERASLEVIAAATSATGAVLRAAGGAAEQRLERRADGPDGAARFGLLVEGGLAEVQARFPDGAYTAVLERPDGTQPAVTLLLASASLPGAPTIEGPADLAAGVALRPVLTWSAPAGATRFDVTIEDAVTGAVALRQTDLSATSLEVPAASELSPSRRYRLIVRAASGPVTAPVRLERGVSSLFDTGAR